MNLRRWLRDEKGNILLFTTALVVPLTIIFGGLALDLAHLGTVDNEVQRSLDAAALAGAGQLRFDSSVFPTARTWAQNYALLNPFRAGGATPATINLGLNTPNATNGDIVLGIWNGSSFTPSLDGTQVNAVLCRYQTIVPMTFLRLLGFTALPVSGEAIAWAAQPATPPPTACAFPVGLSSCFFQSGGSGNTSAGCGATITFITSSDNSQLGANSAAWANLLPNANNVSVPDIRAQVQAAAGGNCQPVGVSSGSSVPTGGGELSSVIKNEIKPAFISKYNSSPELVVHKQDGSDAYRGKGWEVYVPVINTSDLPCPPGSQIHGDRQIVGWTRMVITQVLDKNGECAVANHWTADTQYEFGNPWDSRCFASKNGKAPAGAVTVVQGNTGIFGYYDCQYNPSPPAPNPGPIAATAKLKLVR